MSDSRPLLYACCVDHTITQITTCGREFPVCVECDNGINECTEGECDHPTLGKAMDAVFEDIAHCTRELKHARIGRALNITLIALLVVFYAVTIIVKGWNNDYLFSIIGFATLTGFVYLRHREVKFWRGQLLTIKGMLIKFKETGS